MFSGRALGLVATFTALGAMAGPTIGGVLVSMFPWEVFFVINIPIGIVSLFIGMYALPNKKSVSDRKFDIPGAALIVPAILLIFASITLMEGGISLLSLGLLAVGIVLAVVFALVERKQPAPLVHFGLFRSLSFDIDLAAMVLVFLGLSGALSDRIGCVKPTIAGQAVFALGIFGLSMLSLDTPVTLIVPMLMFTSLGSAMFQSPNNSLIMGHAAPEMLGFVGSLGNLMRYFGQSLGTTISMGVLYGSMSAEAGFEVTGFIADRPELFIHGLSTVFHLLAVLIALALVLSLVRTFVLDCRRG